MPRTFREPHHDLEGGGSVVKAANDVVNCNVGEAPVW